MRRLSILIAFWFLLVANRTQAEDWPEFRGPTGQGLYAGKNLPIEWSVTKNVAWKKPIPGHGWSSPILLDGRIYLTSAVPIEGSSALGPAGGAGRRRQGSSSALIWPSRFSL